MPLEPAAPDARPKRHSMPEGGVLFQRASVRARHSGGGRRLRAKTGLLTLQMQMRDSPPPFRRLGPEKPGSPVVVSVPHAGRAYSEGLLASARLSRARLESLEDRLVDRLVWRAVEGGAAALIADAPRAEIDLNRDERELDPAMVLPRPAADSTVESPRTRGGLGLIPARIAGSGAIWRQRIAAAEVARRVEIIHRPYHSALEAELRAARARFGIAILLDCHSMPPRGGEGEAPVVLGDRHGGSMAEALVAAAEARRPRRRLQGRPQRALCRRPHHRAARPPGPRNPRAPARARPLPLSRSRPAHHRARLRPGRPAHRRHRRGAGRRRPRSARSDRRRIGMRAPFPLLALAVLLPLAGRGAPAGRDSAAPRQRLALRRGRQLLHGDSRAPGGERLSMRLAKWDDMSDSLILWAPGLAPLDLDDEAAAERFYDLEVRIDGRLVPRAMHSTMIEDFDGKPGPSYRLGIIQKPFIAALARGRTLEIRRAGKRIRAFPIAGSAAMARLFAACVAKDPSL